MNEWYNYFNVKYNGLVTCQDHNNNVYIMKWDECVYDKEV